MADNKTITERRTQKAEQETIDDIIAEKRALADGLEREMAMQKECKELMIAHRTAQAIIDSNRREADRLEAALEREKAAIEADALAVGGIVGAAHGRETLTKTLENVNNGADSDSHDNSGNSAKLREAVKAAYDKLLLWNYTDRDTARMALVVMNRLNDALAAPPRNCDRPECATTKAATDVWRKEDGGRTAYYEWLLATATEQEGGNDGNK